MSIVVSCGCGKQLRARDELAGRKAKCPGCGATLRIPVKAFDPEEDVADLIGPPPAVAPTAIAASLPASRAFASSDEQRTSLAGAVALARPAPSVASHTSATRTVAPPKRASFSRHAYALFLLALLPLAWHTFQSHRGGDDALESRF